MKWRPDTDALAECREHGRKIAREWALHPLETPNLSEVDDVIALSQEKARAENQNLGISMQCSVCQWIYDPALGEPLQEVKPGTCWENVPDFFLCPECGLGKSVFDPL